MKVIFNGFKNCIEVYVSSGYGQSTFSDAALLRPEGDKWVAEVWDGKFGPDGGGKNHVEYSDAELRDALTKSGHNADGAIKRAMAKFREHEQNHKKPVFNCFYCS